MKKQTSSLPKPQLPAVPVIVNTHSFGQVFLIKDDKLVPEPDIPENTKPVLISFKSEQEVSNIILSNRAVMFGKESAGLTAKIGSITLPFDAFIFDFSNREEPRCFLLITPKTVLTSMLALIALTSYLKTQGSREMIRQLLIEHISKDKTSHKVFKSLLFKGHTIETVLEYMVSKRLRGLFMTKETDPDSLSLFTSYVEIHSDAIDIIELRKFRIGKEIMLSMTPAFADLKQKSEVEVKAPKEKIIHTEDHHFLKGSAVVRSMYEKLKAAAIKLDKTVLFNAKGSHYISMKKAAGRNLALFHLRKNSIYLVVMLEEKLVRKTVKKSEIKPLRESVQKFWNGKCTGLVFSGTEHLAEITEVLKQLIKQ